MVGEKSFSTCVYLVSWLLVKIWGRSAPFQKRSYMHVTRFKAPDKNCILQSDDNKSIEFFLFFSPSKNHQWKELLDLINLQTIIQELCDVNSSENEDHVCSIFIVNQLKMANASHYFINSFLWKIHCISYKVQVSLHSYYCTQN